MNLVYPTQEGTATLPVKQLGEPLFNEGVYISSENEDNRAMGISNIDRGEAGE